MNADSFERSSHLPISCEEAFAWHERPGAFERMLPPWEQIEVLHKTSSLKDGSTLSLKTQVGFKTFNLTFKHQNYIHNKQFEDVQTKGPFKYWKHTHLFEKIENNKCKIIDHIEYKLPINFISKHLKSALIEDKLDKLFAYRHRTLCNDLYFHSKYSDKKLKILVTGASGLVGKECVPFLTAGGHQVLCLSRQASASENSNTVVWDTEKNSFQNAHLLDELDAVIHLAGENIAEKSWSEERKKELVDSRVNFTKSLCTALLALKKPPKIFLSASGVGIFGNRNKNDILTEESMLGNGFLAKLAKDWENASLVLQEKGTRVVHLRFGAIVSSRGGILKKLLAPYKLFVGGPIGSGKQMLPWISLVDVLGVILFSLANENIQGPINAVSPNTLTNEQFSQILAQALDRPYSLRVPEMVIEFLFGEMGKEMLLAGQHVMPNKLTQMGFEFVQAHLHDALSYYLGA